MPRNDQRHGAVEPARSLGIVDDCDVHRGDRGPGGCGELVAKGDDGVGGRQLALPDLVVARLLVRGEPRVAGTEQAQSGDVERSAGQDLRVVLTLYRRGGRVRV